MCQRQDLDEPPHDVRQRARREERPAEKGHRHEDVEVDLPHFLIGRDIHRRDEADLGEDHAVHDEDEHKERRDRKMCAEEIAERDDDNRGDHPAQHRPRNLADDERIGANRRN